MNQNGSSRPVSGEETTKIVASMPTSADTAAAAAAAAATFPLAALTGTLQNGHEFFVFIIRKKMISNLSLFALWSTCLIVSDS